MADWEEIVPFTTNSYPYSPYSPTTICKSDQSKILYWRVYWKIEECGELTLAKYPIVLKGAKILDRPYSRIIGRSLET